MEFLFEIEGEPQDESDSVDNEDKKDEAATEIKEESSSSKDDITEIVEVSSEQPRGLGLLGSRRRLPLRKPGTIL